MVDSIRNYPGWVPVKSKSIWSDELVGMLNGKRAFDKNSDDSIIGNNMLSCIYAR